MRRKQKPSSPLLVVTGASGVGKTASVSALAARSSTVSCFYFDSIGVPTAEERERKFGSGENWQEYATDTWIARLTADQDSTTVKVLEGQTRPSFVLAALARASHGPTEIALLDCDPRTRRNRLAERGQPELATGEMEAWAAYLRGQADALGLPVIDTSHLSVEEAADALLSLAERLRTP